jgi:MFS family permease
MPDTASSTAPPLPDAPALPHSGELPSVVIARILPTVSLTFVCYLTIGIPLAILPMHVHLQLGYGTVLAGLVISTQYVATVVSRPRVGRMVDVLGPKRIAVLGLFACAASGALTFAAAFFNSYPFACLVLLLLGRLLLGIGESMVGTGAIMWGIGRAGSEHIAKVISWSGIATFSALAVGAPLGVLLRQHLGFAPLASPFWAYRWLPLR